MLLSIRTKQNMETNGTNKQNFRSIDYFRSILYDSDVSDEAKVSPFRHTAFSSIPPARVWNFGSMPVKSLV